MGRPRKFKLGEIVHRLDMEMRLAVIVDHQVQGTKSLYRVIPMDGQKRRFGRAKWVDSNLLGPAGMRSKTASVLTYRANEKLEAELPEGRGCDCMCCVHTADPHAAYNHVTGEFRDE